MARHKREIMIIDYAKCVRVPPGEEWYARTSIPYRCPECAVILDGRILTPQTRSGRLRFDGDPIPKCEDHATPVEMEVVPYDA